ESAKRLGDQKHHDRPADEESYRVDEAIEARDRNQAGDAEEARRANVVAGERESVLKRSHTAARGVELIGRVRSARRPHRDSEREGDEEAEERDGRDVGVAKRGRHRLSPWSEAS